MLDNLERPEERQLAIITYLFSENTLYSVKDTLTLISGRSGLIGQLDHRINQQKEGYGIRGGLGDGLWRTVVVGLQKEGENLTFAEVRLSYGYEIFMGSSVSTKSLSMHGVCYEKALL